MASGNFAKCLAFTLVQEGGYSNDPHDPGGATMYGIIQREYDAWKKEHHLTPSPVRWISSSDRDAIYMENYWSKMSCEQLPRGVDLMVFDYGVNSGVGKSIKDLQKAVGVTADGVLGPKTLAAVNSKSPATLIVTLSAQRLSFLEALRNWKYFGRGWKNRVAAVKAASLAML